MSRHVNFLIAPYSEFRKVLTRYIRSMCHVKSSAVNIGAVEDALYPHLISWKSFYDTLRRVALDTHVRSLRIERHPVDLDRSLRFNGDRYIAERQTACG